MTSNNLCCSCTNIGCEFQSGIVRTKCAFYMPPHIEPDNCGNYVVMQSTYGNGELPNGGWIPVNERLPEDMTYVLTTIQTNPKRVRVRSGNYCHGRFHNDNGDTWLATDEEVTAWMPLPEPYKADKEIANE